MTTVTEPPSQVQAKPDRLGEREVRGTGDGNERCHGAPARRARHGVPSIWTGAPRRRCGSDDRQEGSWWGSAGLGRPACARRSPGMTPGQAGPPPGAGGAQQAGQHGEEHQPVGEGPVAVREVPPLVACQAGHGAGEDWRAGQEGRLSSSPGGRATAGGTAGGDRQRHRRDRSDQLVGLVAGETISTTIAAVGSHTSAGTRRRYPLSGTR